MPGAPLSGASSGQILDSFETCERPSEVRTSHDFGSGTPYLEHSNSGL